MRFLILSSDKNVQIGFYILNKITTLKITREMWWRMQSIRIPCLAAMCGIAWLAVTAPNLEGAVQVVPGTASVVDLFTSVNVVANGITAPASGSLNKTRLVGLQWPEPTFPPSTDPDDWTLEYSREAEDLGDRSFGKSKAKYEADYNGLQTDLLLGASAEGFSISAISPGDDLFDANGNVNGSLDMFLSSNAAADLPGPYDVTLGLTITGEELSATGGLAAAASMSYFVRITPDGGVPVVFSNAFSDLAPPPGGPPFIIQESMNFLGVPLDPNGETFFANVEFGVGVDDGLETFVNGQTMAQPLIDRAEANSLFYSTMALSFVAQTAVPEPGTLPLLGLGILLLARCRRRVRE